MSGGFVKIYGSILQSSVWLEDSETRVLWITMLAMADPSGMVSASLGGIAHAANIPRERCGACLARLAGPDHDSKSKRYQGRRIRAVDGGWHILNYKRYRELRTYRQVQEAERKKEWRNGKRRTGIGTGHVPDVPGQSQMSRAEVEGKAEADAETGTPRRSSRRKNAVDVLAVGELVQRIKALAQRRPTGGSFILRQSVEELGAGVARAYDAVGGSERFLEAKGDKLSFLIREFGEALASASSSR